mmetsp:Transcript_21604/g.45615  ORF Transcript_21604/g.45615 Transcript_21604/m.45615 type:complete len:330 (-) Transcript_21604:3999-4988(-)
MFHLARPAVGCRRARLLVHLAPLRHLLDVRRRVVAVGLVPRLDEVEVVDHLRADSTQPARNDRHVRRSRLERGPRVLHSEGAHPEDDHALAAPVNAHEGVGSAVGHHAVEAVHARHAQRAGHPDAVVDSEHDALGVYDCRLRRRVVRRLLRGHNVVVAIGAKHAHHLDLRPSHVGERLAKLSQIGQHLGRSRVVAVVRVLARRVIGQKLLEAVAPFRRVDLRSRVGVHRPDATDERTLLKDRDRMARLAQPLSLNHSEDPTAHHHHIDARRQRLLIAWQCEGALVEPRPLHHLARHALGHGQRVGSVTKRDKALNWRWTSAVEDGARPA